MESIAHHFGPHPSAVLRHPDQPPRREESEQKAPLAMEQNPDKATSNFFSFLECVGSQRRNLPPSELIRDDANKSCFGVFGLDANDDIWWLPGGMFWQRADALEQVNEMLRLNRVYRILVWAAEKGHITQSIGPFITERMRNERNWINFYQYTPKKDKATRARSFQGLAATGRVHVPKYASWWPDVENQLLCFPSSSEDDVVDMLAHLGKLVDSLNKPDKTEEQEQEDFNRESEQPLTIKGLKIHQRRKEFALNN